MSKEEGGEEVTSYKLRVRELGNSAVAEENRVSNKDLDDI